MRAALLLGSILALAGCTLLAGEPGWVTNRLPLESCGAEDVGQEGDMNVQARQCLLAAYQAGAGAELISTQVSIEGDPITRFIRVHENGTVELFVDATRDAYGSGEWERYRCERLVPVADANDPPDLVFPDEFVFIEDGCEPLPLP
jgi:hypothetical protein